MSRFSFRSKPTDIKLPDDLREGFELKVTEYRSRLKMLTRCSPETARLSDRDDGLYMPRNRDQMHSLYKMEIMKRLLRDGVLNYDELQEEVRRLNTISDFNPEIFRSAYKVVMDYSKGHHGLPGVPGKTG